MAGDFTGKVLFIDLTSGLIEDTVLPEKIYRNFIGGIGLGARILYERMKPNVDPLGPGNILGFVPGLLAGTAVPMSSRYMVVAKSPLTGAWGESNAGGYFGHELKAAGYDAVFFSGISSKPVYLLVYRGKAELRDAADLWGKDTFETQEILRQELRGKVRVACIGPSGESLSLLASVINDDGRAAARCGVGAVMGAKKLKAIAVLGTGKAEIANPSQLNRLRKAFVRDLNNKLEHLPFHKGLRDYGTFAAMTSLIIQGATPIKNWDLIGSEALPGYNVFDADNIAAYGTKRSGCFRCPIACGGTFNVKESQYRIDEGHKVDYETLAALGPMCLNTDVESIIKADDICDRYGIDTMSAGAVIAFAIECYENGIIGKEDTRGIKLTWGNASAIVAMLGKIVRREGFGNVLADGVRKAAERIGRGSEKYAIHIHGQEPAYHDPRLFPSRGLGYISDPTPGHHMISSALIRLEGGGSLGPYPELQFPEEGISDYQRQSQIYITANSYTQTVSSSGICLFAVSCGIFPLIEFIAAVTGWDFTVKEAIITGRRILTLRQAFNIREGLTASEFTLPDRIARPPNMGPYSGRSIDFNALRSSYYEAMGWDTESGKPSEQTLGELGLRQLVGILPRE